jgi:hypothetical protein
MPLAAESAAPRKLPSRGACNVPVNAAWNPNASSAQLNKPTSAYGGRDQHQWQHLTSNQFVRGRGGWRRIGLGNASLGGAGRNEPQKAATRFRAECLTKLHSQAGHFTRQGVACENARVALFPAQCGRLHALGDFLRLEFPGLILLKECAPSE